MRIPDFLAAMAIAALVVGTASTASAQSPAKHKGLYVSGGAGVNWLEDSDISGDVSGEIEFDTGWMAGVAVGYGFGNGLRFEGELSYRKNDVDRAFDGELASSNGDVSAGALMGNLVYDFDVSPSVIPYIGLGAGLAVVEFDDIVLAGLGDTIDDDDTVFAWQALAGVAFPLRDQLDLTVDYRYFQTADPDLRLGSGGKVEGEYSSHSLMLGLRYRFAPTPRPAPRPRPAAAEAPPLPPVPAKPEPAPMAKPKPAPAPAPEPRSFIVFFDWDRANIRPDAQRVLEAAVDYARQRGLARVNLAGHADRSGPAQYNMGLSLRRAEAVKAALIRLGLSEGDIALVAKGESEPLVATADGVREPRNRRVEIVF